MYGPERLVADLRELGYAAEGRSAGNGQEFAFIPGYEVQLGRFAGRRVGLCLPAPPDFPRSVGAALHVAASPHLLEVGQIPGRRNVIVSPLGDEWQYWSHNFGWTGERSTRRLMAQVNRIFLDV